MKKGINYSSASFIIASTSLGIISLLIISGYIEIKDIHKNYCISQGYEYKELKYENKIKNYCIINNSICLAKEFYENNCSKGKYEISNCTKYEGKTICTQEYKPVCAIIQIGVTEPYTYEEKTWGNACSACINNKPTEKIINYINESCDKI